MPFQWLSWMSRKDDEIPPVDLDAMLLKTLRHEGGYSNDPDDPGGPTMYGCTLATYRAYYRNDSLTEDDLRKATEEEIRTIFLQEYFYKPRLNLLSGRIAPAVFDFGINAGPAQSIKILQRTCNTLRRTSGALADDGIMGPLTAKKANSLPSGPVLAAFCDRRVSFYVDLVNKRPELRCYLNGWRKRAMSYRKEDES